MKKYITLFITLLITANPAYSDSNPCQRRTIKKQLYRQELKRFIQDSEQKGEFKFGRGIVILGERYDNQGQLNWLISVAVEDGYQETTPAGWTMVKDKVVLIYQGDWWIPSTPTAEVSTCLIQIVDNRVFERPPRSWLEPLTRAGQAVVDSTGRPIMVTRYRDIVGGGPGNAHRIIFEKSGRIIRLKSV